MSNLCHMSHFYLGTEAVWVMAPMSVGGGGASCSVIHFSNHAVVQWVSLPQEYKLKERLEALQVTSGENNHNDLNTGVITHCRFDLYHHHFADDSDFVLKKWTAWCWVDDSGSDHHCQLGESVVGRTNDEELNHWDTHLKWEGHTFEMFVLLQTCLKPSGDLKRAWKRGERL